MAGVGNKIEAVDYNNIQSKIALIMGTGSSDSGYGQSLASSQVVIGNPISVTQWNNLRTDLVKARQHQTGVAIGTKSPSDVGYVAGADLTVPSSTVKVKEEDRAAYNAIADTITLNKLIVPPLSQASRDTLVSSTRSTAWNGTLTHTVTVSFTDSDAARYFFNSGGQLWISGSRTGSTAPPGSKNYSWSQMLTNMGIIKFGYTETTATGNQSGTVLGYYDLTTSNQLIFEKSTEAPTYSPNTYRVYAKLGASGTSAIWVTFSIEFRDDSPAPPSPYPGYGIDENVDGTLTSTIESYRSFGANVQVALPSVPANSGI